MLKTSRSQNISGSLMRVLLGTALSLTCIVPAYAQQPEGQEAISLAPPAGSVSYLSAHATGTQDYICAAGADGSAPAWVFFGPQATLGVQVFGEPLQVATHFLRPLPSAPPVVPAACSGSPETGEVSCPSWQSSLDTSAVWGSKVASVPGGSSPELCPNSGAIPCLLLKAVATQQGTYGGGLLSSTTYIQRIHTQGGSAPAGTCQAGDQALVPYSADYVFFQGQK